MSKLQKNLWFTFVLLFLLAVIVLVGWLAYQASQLGQPKPAPTPAPRPVDSSNVLELQIGGNPSPPTEKIFDFSGMSWGDAIAKGGAEGARPAAEALGKATEEAGDAAAKAVRKIPSAVEAAEKQKKPPK